MFKVDDKVIYVDDSPGFASGEKLLEKDKVYTIQRIDKSTKPGMVNIFVRGVVGGWHSIRFVKADQYRTKSLTKELAKLAKESTEVIELDKEELLTEK